MDLNLAGISTARLLHLGGLDCQGRHLPRLAPAQPAPVGEQEKGEHGESAIPTPAANLWHLATKGKIEDCTSRVNVSQSVSHYHTPTNGAHGPRVHTLGPK